MEAPIILIADDDREIVNLIADSLEDEGYRTLKACNGREAVEQLWRNQISLLILDIMMPGMDGLEVCRKVRNEITIPIIILSAKGREIDKIVGLEVGADDYITKPFSINELIARVNAHIRREKRSNAAASASSVMLQFDNLIINKDNFEVFKDGNQVELSTKEFQILVYLAENRNRVLTREQIYDAIWGHSEYGDINTVTVHIKNLRTKLDTNNEYIKTIWGVGYKFTGGQP